MTAKKKIEIARESLATAQEEASAILQATRSVSIPEGRCEWLYSRNPDGPAVLWAARDTGTGQMAGFTVCLPRRLLYNGQQIAAWNGADFSILPKYRSLGVALKLRRAAKQEIDSGNADLLYSHPNRKMQVIHAKVGHVQVGRMVRYAKPIRFKEKLPRTIPRVIRQSADAIAAPLLSRSPAEWTHRPQNEVQAVSKLKFDTRYDHLFADAHHNRTLVGVRDSTYLDWRYRQYPNQQFQLLEATNNGHLVGYLLSNRKDETIFIQDVFAATKIAGLDLLMEAIRFARRSRAQSVSMTVLESSEFIHELLRAGFRERPGSSNMFSYASPENLSATIERPENWFIHVGDRDV